MEYRKVIIESCNELLRIDRELLTTSVNIAMNGEYEELNNLFNSGDCFEFEWGYFENSSDSNLEAIISLHKQIRNTLNDIIYRNNILQEELDGFHNQ